jgi:hypothetical protein
MCNSPNDPPLVTFTPIFSLSIPLRVKSGWAWFPEGQSGFKDNHLMSLYGGDNGVSIAVLEINLETLALRR